MAAARLRRVDGAGDGKHLAPQLQGLVGGDQRARRQRRLHHQAALAERGDQAVALRKVRRQRWRAQRVFADQAAAQRHFLGQRLVALGVDAVQPSAHHCHRGQGQCGAPAQSPLVGGGVNAQRQA